MSIRHTVARWLYPEVFRANEWLRENAEQWQANADKWSVKAMKRGTALRNISSLRTPSCAHIGKRMADIADAALKEGEG